MKKGPRGQVALTVSSRATSLFCSSLALPWLPFHHSFQCPGRPGRLSASHKAPPVRRFFFFFFFLPLQVPEGATIDSLRALCASSLGYLECLELLAHPDPSSKPMPVRRMWKLSPGSSRMTLPPECPNEWSNKAVSRRAPTPSHSLAVPCDYTSHPRDADYYLPEPMPSPLFPLSP